MANDPVNPLGIDITGIGNVNDIVDNIGLSDVPTKIFGNKDIDKVNIVTDANLAASTSINRARETAVSDEDPPFITVTLKTIDEAIINHLNNKIKPTISVNGNSISVPTIYGNSERWNNARKEGIYRDIKGKIQTPIIMIRRINVMRNMSLINPVNKYHRYMYEKQWDKNNAYSKFNIQNGIVPTRQFVEVMAPDYVEVNYEAIIWTEMHEQMNAVIEQLNFEMDEYWGSPGNFKFKVKTDDFQNQTDLPADSARTVRSTFNLLVRGYLLPKHSLGVSTARNVYSTKKVVMFTEVDNTGE